MKMLTLPVLVLGLSTALAAGRFPTDYEFSVVDFPGATNTTIFAVNNRGQFVGAEKDPAGAHHAIFDDGRQLRLLDPTGVVGTSAESWAYSINNVGEIVGAYATAAGELHGFVHHSDGTVTTIDFPSGFDTQAFGINDRGSLVGVYSDSSGNPHAFALRQGRYVSADVAGGIQTVPLSINDHEEIVGEFITTPNTNGFGYLQKPSGAVTLTTAPGSQPQGTFFISINNANRILGGYEDASGGQQNFLEADGRFRHFDLPSRLGATVVSAQTINDRGEIVGWYADASNVNHGFVAIPILSRWD